MEGEGAYNRHARLAAGGAGIALPFLEKAAHSVVLGPGESPVVIADYGSSQGKNSLAPIGFAIQCLRSRIGPEPSILVAHIDQPRNDFNSLFAVLNGDPGSYVRTESNVFSCAIGKSFYEQVLPANSVHLGWSSYAAQWLSRPPAVIPDHFFVHCSTDAVRFQIAHQAAQDWEAFLALRARELRTGGRVVLILPGFGDSGLCGFEPGMNRANIALSEMVQEGAITAEEKARMVIGGYIRHKDELLAPFLPGGGFETLKVEACESFEVPDAAWAQYQQDGDVKAFALKHALFFRSVFTPSLASALNRVRSGDTEAFRAFADRLERGMRNQLEAHPAPAKTFVQVMILAKQDLR
jgi:hypothetical protein